MCGRYVLALRYDQVCRVLEENGVPVENVPPDDDQNTFQPTYNLAPGYQGLVCRAVVSRRSEEDTQQPEHVSEHKNQNYKLQAMKWGLVPSWVKRRPNYSSMLKTINCRSDSLAQGGIWASMRGHKRCVVVAQGFFEWRKAGPKNRVPYYIRRHDGRPLLFAGLWDCALLDGEDGSSRKLVYTYTIITTDSSEQMRFVHDRMPVIFDFASTALKVWLDPLRNQWSDELQSLLQPWPEKGPLLDVDVVSQDVNKVGRSSPSYIIPVASSAHRATISNAFRSNKKEKASCVASGSWEIYKAKTGMDGGNATASGPSASPVTAKRKASIIIATTDHYDAVQKDMGANRHANKKNKTDDPENQRKPNGGNRKITSYFAKRGN